MRPPVYLPLVLALVAGCNRGGKETAAADPPGQKPADPPASAPAPDPPPVSPKPRPPADTRRATGAEIPGWGKVIDPDGDCTIREEADFVSIAVPNTLHDINPTKDGRNSPRIMTPVFGDFAAVVRVTGTFEPEPPSTSRMASPFNGAGLVLWEDQRNLLILARNAWHSPGGQYHCFAPLFELFEDGRGRPTNPPVTSAAAFRGESTALYLERKGDTIRGAYSHDGRTWEGWRQTTARIPKNAQVGITVLNTSSKPFAVTFDGFKVRQE